MGFLQAITENCGKIAAFASENKDKILLVGGFVCGGLALGTTVRATIKCKDIIDEHKDNLQLIEAKAELDETYALSKDIKDDTVKTYGLTALGIAKNVVVPVIFAAGSAACFVGEHVVMENKVEKLTETVVGLSAAYTAIDTAFKKYRKNVINELGKEADDRFRHGIKKDENATVIEFDENGNEKVSKKDIYYTDEPDPSDYAKFYGGVNSDGTMNTEFVWMDPLKRRPDWDANIHLLNCKQSMCQRKLEDQGYLFLNDVYEELGLPKTKAGQVVGWIFDPENPNIDSRVSFGTYRICNRKVVNCEDDYEYEECILLDFNVDGVIIDKINKIADR